MSRYERDYITIADIYRAYRKAKTDAFYENSHFHAIAFAEYESNLDRNLRRLLRRLENPKAEWARSPTFLGGIAFFPKSLGKPDKEKSDGIHFATLDPARDWKAACDVSRKQVKASFRQIITPSVDYQIISALWVLKVGHIFDAALDPSASYGHRLRRIGSTKNSVGRLNLDCNGLFAPYFSAYRKWRSDGLDAMRHELEQSGEIYAATMDIRSFYHSVSPAFLLRPSFLEEAGVVLDDRDEAFTSDLLESIASWYHATPDYKARPSGALPVGLSASKIISNVLLLSFDRLVKEKLQPLHYGRYVDDIFLVVRAKKDLSNGVEFMRWLADELEPDVVFRQEGSAYHLKFEPHYALDSEIIFAGDKQKIFHLKGKHGLDLVEQIAEQIRQQSSEHRLLPILPDSESEMLSQALLTTPDASLEADALRKADVVSIRRLGFSLLIRDIEGYSRDLSPKDWRKHRHVFYGFVNRYVLTPQGYFDYFSYISRAFGLIVANGDFKAAQEFLDRFNTICLLLEDTTSAGAVDRKKFQSSRKFYAHAFQQVATQASTIKGFRFGAKYLSLIRSVRKILGVRTSNDLRLLRLSSRGLLISDLGRRPYREYWFKENRKEGNIPSLPTKLSIHKVLRLDLVRKFRESLNKPRTEDPKRPRVNAPYWPAVTFPTRPLTIPEITAIAPNLLESERQLRDAIFGLRGARVIEGGEWPYSAYVEKVKTIFVPPATLKNDIAVAVASYLTTDLQWRAAYDGKPDRSLKRYEHYRLLVNRILESKARPDYVAFPELSLPRRWAFGAAIKFSQNGISLITGLENNNHRGHYRNDALISLTTSWPGYRTHVYHIQPKIEPAHHEAVNLVKPKRKLFKANDDECRPIYAHGQHIFGVLICSDLTTIANRAYLQGNVDTLFVVEWNQDLTTFSHLVDSTAHDLHGYIVQANNRAYGDSRIRGPFAVDHRRDIVRVRGGIEDYFVVAVLNIGQLRQFQQTFSPKRYEATKKKQIFKPLPIGYKISPLRK